MNFSRKIHLTFRGSGPILNGKTSERRPEYEAGNHVYNHDGRERKLCVDQGEAEAWGRVMKCFRIYTEDVNERKTAELLKISFDGFIVVRTTGFWKGKGENSICVEIYTNDANLVRAVAERLKHHNKQEAVLVTETECRVELV